MRSALFNENHKSYIRVVFQSVDELLAKAVQFLEIAPSSSPFSDHVPDATPVQCRVIADYATRLRNAMCRLLAAHGVSLPERKISSVWAARAAIISAKVSVDELTPRIVRGYGPMADEDIRNLEVIIAELFDLLNRMDGFLAQGPGRDMASRLARLEQTTNEGLLLRELDRVVAAYGLVEFRGTLDMLIERLESNTLEVAVFGRVSSGKSSLLDYLLQTDMLPIGVTPVTAVPVRITYNPESRAIIHLAEMAPLIVDPRRLAEFATEQQNPANAKHVTRIQLELPSPRLHAGITFVDTPGLGSLALAGGAESLLYLPRCDLGIVLIDAASTLVAEDVSLVQSLYQAGAEVAVLLSKADVLSDQDRHHAAEYARRQLQAQLGMEPSVHLVSVRGAEAKLCDGWYRDALLPCLDNHRQRFQSSLRRKIGALRDAVVDVLKQRTTPRAPTETQIANRDNMEQSLAAMLVQLERARYSFPDLFVSAGASAHDVLKEAAGQIAAGWNDNDAPSREATAIIKSAVDNAGQRMASLAATGIQQLHQALANALEQVNGAVGGTTGGIDELPLPSALPLPDFRADEFHAVVSRPLLGFFGASKAAQGIFRQLEGQVFRQLTDTFDRYQRQLRDWRRLSLDEMQRSFTARADLYRARMSATPRELGQSGDQAVTLDHEIEQLLHFGEH
jgi:GTP-binding protein EngB required for normal cell division